MARERIQWPALVDRAGQIGEGYAPLKVTLRQVMHRSPPRECCRPRRRCTAACPRSWPKPAARAASPTSLTPCGRSTSRQPGRTWTRSCTEAPDWFRLDRTEGQQHALYVAAEKDILRQLLTDWLAPYGIPVLVVRGFGSQTYVDVVRDRTAADPRDAHLAYVGDFDASGADVERDWVERTGCWSRVTRVLLTHDQVQRYALPATEGKRNDPRWPAFARRYGFDIDHPVQWEVEALEPDELQRLVLAAVTPYVDRDVLAEQIAREEQQRRALADLLSSWDAAGGRPL